VKRFDLEEERIKQEIVKFRARRVLVQLPEGLKPEATRLAKIVEKSGALAIVSADPCYGACDLATNDAERLGVDLVIHYGHSKLVRYEQIPTIYVEARANVSVNESVEKALPLLEKWQRIGIIATVQHVQTLDCVREILTRAGKIVVIGDTGGLSYPGQVVGCNHGNAKSIAKDVEAFLVISGGQFHALGVALATSKHTVVADPYDSRAFSVDKEAEKILKQRWASVEEAKRAKSFVVLIGLKQGQQRLDEALQLKRKLEDNGKAAFLFAAREITPEVLMEFPTVEAYINTACPRISVDDGSRFQKPVLTMNEALVVVGELPWEELCRKGLLES
jgi:2-(3-amino-3-carboxypropyl)histidine synthase